MEVGDVVEFETGDRHLLAVLTRELGQKWIVVTEGGDEMRPAPDDVTFELGQSLDASGSQRALTRSLEKIRQRIDEAAADIDVSFLWEFVDAGEAVSPEMLSELFFESSEPIEVLAVLKKLRDDTVYFKSGHDGWEPREPDQVEELKRQREAKEERRRQRQAFIDGVVEVLEAEPADRSEMIEERMADPEFRSHMATLQGYAIHGNDFGDSDDASDLLESIEEGADTQIDGGSDTKAFNLMVDLGIWDEHENLWVHRYNLDGDPDEETQAEANQVAEADWEPEDWRSDMTDRLCVSIDDASTRDIDDALSCRRLPDGGWEVGIHVADPDAFVEKGSRLDRHARRRATSVYLPERTINMFPPEVSEKAASLVAGSRRPAITTLAEFDEDFEILDWSIQPSVVDVDQRLTYEEVDACLDGDDTLGENLSEMLGDLATIAENHRASREEKGAVSIDLPEPKFDITWEDGEPNVELDVRRDESKANELVSEFMIMAGYLAGRLAWLKDIPILFRSQDAPEGEVRDERVEEAPDGLPTDFALLRKMKPGNMSTEPNEHFGLGLPVYTQATSPIRRYADLVCQRQIKAWLTDQPLPYEGSELVEVLGDVESNSSEAGRAQGGSARYWTLEYLRQHKDDGPFEAEVIEHYNDDGTKAAVWVHAIASKETCRFRTAVPVGEEAKVEVNRVDPRGNQLSLKQA
jgi:exoribonuclease-2